MDLKTSANMKICLNGKSSTYNTRLGNFFTHGEPSDIKIITSSIESIKDLFNDRKIQKKYKNTNIKIIVNEEFNLEQDFIQKWFVKYYNVTFKKVKYIYFNLFIKSSSHIIDFELFPLGFKTRKRRNQSQPILDSEFDVKSNVGFNLKINNSKFKIEMEKIFDRIWETGELFCFETINIIYKKECVHLKDKDDNGGYNFDYINVSISSTIIRDRNPKFEVDFNNIVKMDLDYDLKNIKSKLRIYDDCAELSFSDIDGNMSIRFNSKVLLKFCELCARNLENVKFIGPYKVTKLDITNFDSEKVFGFLCNNFHPDIILNIRNIILSFEDKSEKEKQELIRKLETTAEKIKSLKTIHNELSYSDYDLIWLQKYLL